MNKDKNKVLIYIGNLYNFDQFHLLIIEFLHSKKLEVSLLIEKSSFNDNFLYKVKSINSKKLIKSFFI